jgi:hypothetical protein
VHVLLVLVHEVDPVNKACKLPCRWTASGHTSLKRRNLNEMVLRTYGFGIPQRWYILTKLNPIRFGGFLLYKFKVWSAVSLSPNGDHRHWGFDYLSKETIHINSLASIVRFD